MVALTAVFINQICSNNLSLHVSLSPCMTDLAGLAYPHYQQKESGSTIIIILMSTEGREGVPERLFYRVYPTFIEATKEQLAAVNRHSFYRISVFQGETLLGEMMEGASPAILADKIFLTKALINFNQEPTGGELVLKLTEHFEGDRLLGVGTYDLQTVRQKFLEQSQRFFSLQTALLNTPDGAMKLLFSLFVESDRHELDRYIKKFKENERNVLRARRNINNYKKEMLHRAQERDRTASNARRKPQKDLSDIKEAKEDSKLEKNEEQPVRTEDSEIRIFLRREREREEEHDNISFGSAPSGNYLEIDSAAKFHTKKFEKKINKLKKTLNEAEEREFQAYSNIIEELRGNSNLVSSLDIGTASLISDGSEESEMRFHEEKETYSEKAIKNFKGNVNKCFNWTMIALALLLIYFVIAPTKRFTKPQRSGKGPRRASRAGL